MWLGERITDKGVGNGISLLIMIGIIARFPSVFCSRIAAKTTESKVVPMMILIEVIVWFVMILASVLLVTAVRKVGVQYAKRTSTGAVTN